MYKILPYTALFVVVVLLQVFLFDNLSISIYLNPLIYLAFILLLPMDIRPLPLLLWGVVVGVVVDHCMGAAGINTIATLPIAFFRPTLLTLLMGRDESREGGIPSPERLGSTVFWQYLIVTVLIHHTLFFLLEALSWANLLHTLLRIVLSSALSVGFIWLITRIFTSKTALR